MLAQFLEFLLLSLFTQLKRSDYLFIISQNELYFYSPMTYHTMTHHSTKKRWWHASFFSLSDLSHQWEPSQFATAKTDSSQKHGLVSSNSFITNCMRPMKYVCYNRDIVITVNIYVTNRATFVRYNFDISVNVLTEFDCIFKKNTID